MIEESEHFNEYDNGEFELQLPNRKKTFAFEDDGQEFYDENQIEVAEEEFEEGNELIMNKHRASKRF